jgi:hypothetical protein
MSNTTEETVRKRAYELWEMSGRKGLADEHWHRAERELTSRPDTSPARQGFMDPGAEPAVGTSAGEFAERLRPFYISLPTEPVPPQHWDMIIELALGPDPDFRKVFRRVRPGCPQIGRPHRTGGTRRAGKETLAVGSFPPVCKDSGGSAS